MSKEIPIKPIARLHVKCLNEANNLMHLLNAAKKKGLLAEYTLSVYEKGDSEFVIFAAEPGAEKCQALTKPIIMKKRWKIC